MLLASLTDDQKLICDFIRLELRCKFDKQLTRSSKITEKLVKSVYNNIIGHLRSSSDRISKFSFDSI